MQELGVHNSIDMHNENNRAATQHRNEKLKTPHGESVIHPSNLDKWTDDFCHVPDVSERNSCNHFVYRLQTRHQVKVMYEDRHVHSIKVCLHLFSIKLHIQYGQFGHYLDHLHYYRPSNGCSKTNSFKFSLTS